MSIPESTVEVSAALNDISFLMVKQDEQKLELRVVWKYDGWKMIFVRTTNLETISKDTSESETTGSTFGQNRYWEEGKSVVQ